jgi:rhomboid protease GluP
VLTKLLIAANVVAYVLELVSGSVTMSGQTYDTGIIVAGDLNALAVAQGEWWRIFTSAFLHAGWIHIGSNMFALYQVGTFIELVYGRVRMAVLYLVGILGASFACLWFAPQQTELGASGAIFALFGALLAAGLRWGKDGRSLVQQSSGIIILNLVLGFTVLHGIISNTAHIGGLVVGTLAGLVLFRVPRPRVAVAGEPLEAGVTYQSPEAIVQAQATGEAAPSVAPHDPAAP